MSVHHVLWQIRNSVLIHTIKSGRTILNYYFLLKPWRTPLSLSRFKSCVCLISSTSSESGQVAEVAKLAKSGLFGAPVYTKSLSWHNFGQNISDISKLLSSWLSHICLCFCEGRECCFVFVAEFQNFMAGQLTHFISLHCVLLLSVVYISTLGRLARNTHRVLNYNCH